MNTLDADVPVASTQEELCGTLQKILCNKSFIQLPDIAMFFDTLPIRIDSLIASSDIKSLLIVLQILSTALPALHNWREDVITEIVNAIVRCLTIKSLQPCVCDLLNQLHDCFFLRGLIINSLNQKRGVSENALNEQVGLVLTQLERKEITEYSTHLVDDDSNKTALQTTPGSVILRTPKYLDVSFLPPSMSEQWILSTDPDEVVTHVFLRLLHI